MSDDNEIRDTKIENKWTGWIEEAISKEYFRYYDHKYFSNIQKIGTGGFGRVYRAKWKNSEYLALKSFFNLDEATAKEIVHELKLQRDIQFYNNIIKFYGIAQFDPENQKNDNVKNYLLVMEYADSGTLKNYLKKNFESLTWEDKYNLAYQLACAVSCLHNERIVHRDLHSSNVLIHQNNLRLSDFGLSKRIDSSSNIQSKFFGVIPYVDPKRFTGRRKNKQSTQVYSLNEKSDVYSVGVLLWEISSGRAPFYAEGEQYDVDLAIEISQGLREEPIPDTPEIYMKLYTECWDGDPDNRPTMNQIVERLKAMITKTIIIMEQSPLTEEPDSMTSTSSNIDSSLHGDLSQVIENFDNMNTKEMSPVVSNEYISLSDDLNIIVSDIVNYIYKINDEGKVSLLSKQFLDHLNVNSQEIYNWLLDNQDNPDSIFLLGYFNYLGIETDKNTEKAIDLFISASEHDHALAQYYVGLCYEFGYGAGRNEMLAFESYKKIANEGCSIGLSKIGCFYKDGIGIHVNKEKAFEFFQKAADLGNSMAKYNLAIMYINGEGTDNDYNKAFELIQQLAESELPDGIMMLGHCYENGIGTDVSRQKAIEFYQKAANLGHSVTQVNLAVMYLNGDGVDRDFSKTFELSKQSAEEKYPNGIMMLGYCYENGIGTDVDKQKAFELYQKAANLGEGVARYNLALMYEKGDGVEQDMDKAIYWYEKSAKRGNQGALEKLETLRKNSLPREKRDIREKRKTAFGMFLRK